MKGYVKVALPKSGSGGFPAAVVFATNEPQFSRILTMARRLISIATVKGVGVRRLTCQGRISEQRRGAITPGSQILDLEASSANLGNGAQGESVPDVFLAAEALD